MSDNTSERAQSHNGKAFRISTALFVLVLIIFAAAKIQTIATPYFWDELGVYVPGALKMKDNGTIGLLPASLEPLYSRGHPLLFVFSQASWFHIIGDTPVAGHAFSILLALETLIVWFLCARNLLGEWVAVLSSALLAVQPMFFAMAGVILPEMMLTLFTIPAIWAIIRKKWLVFAITGSLAMMTKESAIVIPPLAMLVIFIDSLFARKIFAPHTIGGYILAAVPLMVYGLFLLIQKRQNGWYFFPEHTSYLFKNGIFEHAWYIVREMLFDQGRVILGVSWIAGLVWVNVKKSQQKRVFNIASGFIFLSIFFANLNFYLSRYLLFCLPFILVCGIETIHMVAKELSGKAHIVFVALASAITAILSTLSFDTGKFNDNADMSYLHMVHTEKQAIEWLEQQPWKDSLIEANFPIFQALGDMRNGYLTVKPFTVSVNYEKRAPYGLWFHFKEDESIVWDGRSYTVIKRWKMPYAYISAVKY